MDPPKEQKRNTVPRKSKADQLPWDQQALRIREPVSGSETKEIKNFVEKLNTDVKFEIQFLKDMLNYHSSNNKYPFQSSQALEDFAKTWIGLNISKPEMLALINKLKEKYWRRVKKYDEDLFSLEGDEDEAFAFGEGIWGLDNEKEYADDEIGKNNNQENQEEGSGIGQGQDRNV